MAGTIDTWSDAKRVTNQESTPESRPTPENSGRAMGIGGGKMSR